MKVEFDHAKYGRGDHTVSTGYATIIIVDGKAEIDVGDEALVILAKSLGAKTFVPPAIIKAIEKRVEETEEQKPKAKSKRGKQK